MTEVVLHEEHGEAVASWVALGYRGEHVVCLDRHLDLKPLSAMALRECASASGEELPSLNRALPLREAPGAFGLDDFWSAGPVSGRVNRLTWVVPGVVRGSAGRRRLLSAVSYIRADPDIVERTSFDGDRLRTDLCGLPIDICSLDNFLAVPPSSDFRIDVDLDWFAVPGQPDEFDPRLFAEELCVRGWLDRVDSLTYSVRSGFLEDSQRRIADDLLDAAGRTGRCDGGSTLRATPDRSLAALRGGAKLAPDAISRIVDSELRGLAALGDVVEGLLRLYCTRVIKSGEAVTGLPAAGAALHQAEHCWRLAAAEGVHSTWLAYGLGQRWYELARYKQAQEWFDRARGELNDPLEGHAQTLATLCSTHLGDLHGAADRAVALAAAFPLNQRVGSLAVATAERAGLPPDPDIVRRLAVIAAWTNGDNSS